MGTGGASVFRRSSGGAAVAGTTDNVARIIAANVEATAGLTPPVEPQEIIFSKGKKYKNPNAIGGASIPIPSLVTDANMLAAGFVEAQSESIPTIGYTTDPTGVVVPTGKVRAFFGDQEYTPSADATPVWVEDQAGDVSPTIAYVTDPLGITVPANKVRAFFNGDEYKPSTDPTPVWEPVTTVSAVKLHTLSVADVNAAQSETPSDAQLLAAFNAKTDSKSGDYFMHATPLGITVKGVVIDGVVFRDQAQIPNYDTLPLENLFAPNTKITVTDTDNLETKYTLNAGGNAWLEGDYEGASGGAAVTGTEVDTLATVTARGNIATGDIEIPAGNRLIMTDAGGERLAVTIGADDGIETNPA